MNLQTLDTTECLQLLNSGEISSVELLDIFTQQMAQHNPAINAVIETNLEAAMVRAQAADDARANGKSWGPLHGLPITIKDTYEVIGMRTTAGANSLKDHRPETNAVAVQKLIDAGGIVWGKTNTPPYATDIQTYNDLHGITNNPWDVSRTSGGSSGGSAAAVAAGFTTLELGSDIAGSIRTPANFCGVYGHKPTHGIVSFLGQIPGPPGSKGHPDLGVAGPLARSADDLVMALDLLAGPDPLASVGWTLNLPKPRHKRLSDFRVAIWLDDEECTVESEIVEMLQHTADVVRQAGATITEAKPAGHKEILSVYYTLLSAVMASGLPRETYNMFASMDDQAVSDYLAENKLPENYRAQIKGRTARHKHWLGANERRAKIQYRCKDFFNDYDVLLMPITPNVAPLHDTKTPVDARRITINGQDRSYVDQFPWIGLATMAGLPATAAPIGRTKGGMPVGVQIVGPYLEDKTTLEFAKLLAEVQGGFEAPAL